MIVYGIPATRRALAALLPRGRARTTPSPGTALAWMILVALGPAGAAAQQAHTLAGTVLDAQSGRPVADVVVSVAGTELGAVTDASGGFRVEGVPAGSRQLVFRHIAYGEHSRPVEVADDVPLQFEVAISPRAIEMSPVVVEARSQRELDQRASGNVVNQIVRPEIERAASRGLRLPDVLRQQMPGIRWRRVGGRDCIEYRQQYAGMGCRDLTVVLDGAPSGDAGLLLASLSLDDIERVEVLSPSQAGARYGTLAGRGVLLVETRSGSAQSGNTGRALAKFDWSLDPETHPTRRVWLTSLAGTAATVGLSYWALDRCTFAMEGSLQLRPGCNELAAGAAGFGAFVLPGAVTGLSARMVGATERSRGRASLSIFFGSLTTWTGHLLFFNGRSNDSGALQAAGLGVIAVGTPLVVTVSDRVFRSLR